MSQRAGHFWKEGSVAGVVEIDAAHRER